MVPDRPEVKLGVDRLHDLLATDVLEQDVGVGGSTLADRSQCTEEPGGGRADLLGADREGDLGMVLVGGARIEIGSRHEERHQHQEHEPEEGAPVPGPEPRRPHVCRYGRGGARSDGSSKPALAPPPAPPLAWRGVFSISPGTTKRRRSLFLVGQVYGAKLGAGRTVVGGWRHRPFSGLCHGDRRDGALVIALRGGLLVAAHESKPRQGLVRAQVSIRCRLLHKPFRSRHSEVYARASSGCG